MGRQGARLTDATTQACEEAVALLRPWVELAPRKMFGGYGLFHEGTMLGLVDSSGQLRLRASPENRAARLAAGATQHGKMLYFSIPKNVRADREELTAWIEEARSAARASKR